MMPRDVATHWNYTFEMLSFAYTYRDAYNELTSNQDMKMRKYEIEDLEWEIVKQLADVLKVYSHYFSSVVVLLPAFLDFQRCQAFFFLCDAQPCKGDPSDGPHQPTPCLSHM
jgi:hypothetical protein